MTGSLPNELLDRWRKELASAPSQIREDALRARIEDHLDASRDECWLQHSEAAEIVENAFLYGEGQSYELHAWVVMPNHVHVVLTRFANTSLPEIIQRWKGYTSRLVARRLGLSGRLWQPDYFDRLIRDDKHFIAAMEYCEYNPVKAGLCAEALDWRFSSARRRR